MDSEVSSAAGGIVALVMLGITAVFYIYFAIAFQTMAKKTNTPNGWMAWLPLLNVILMVKIAQKPAWWAALILLVPFVNLIMTIIVMMEISKRLGKPDWAGALIIVPGVNFFIPGYLAFSK